MAQIFGTGGPDRLFGTAEADIFMPAGTNLSDTPDFMSGLDGADEYFVTSRSGGISYLNYVIEDGGGDGAEDVIHGRGFYASASLGYSAWGIAERVGDDLVIDTPGKPYRFHKPGYPAAHVTVSGHFAGDAVEKYDAAGHIYDIATNNIGRRGDDLIAGSAADDLIKAKAGGDIAFGAGGDDVMKMGGGDDIALGGDGDDRLIGGGGVDGLMGEAGNDTLLGGGGGDVMEGGDGRDLVKGGAGSDFMRGGDGNDKLKGGGGGDLLDGEGGADVMIGGRGGDVYRVGVGDVVFDRGDADVGYGLVDTVEIGGLYGPSSGGADEALARLSFSVAGDDLVIGVQDDGEIRLRGMIGNERDAIEVFTLSAGYWTPKSFIFVVAGRAPLGDDRAHQGGFSQEANEVLVGSDGDDAIYGGSGVNFIWTGDGADTLIFKEDDPMWDGLYSGYHTPGISAHIVEDFDPAADRLDFTEIAGLGFEDLTVRSQDDGDAIVVWDSGSLDIADISIELRGVTADQVTEDLFIFA